MVSIANFYAGMRGVYGVDIFMISKGNWQRCLVSFSIIKKTLFIELFYIKLIRWRYE